MTDNWITSEIPSPMDETTVNKLHNWLKSMLPMGPMTITFTKADGTERVMNCTLDPNMLPITENKPLAEGKQPRKESTTSIRVFDLDKKEWRSFTTKNVRRVQLSI